jgi:hypothetical protein
MPQMDAQAETLAAARERLERRLAVIRPQIKSADALRGFDLAASIAMSCLAVLGPDAPVPETAPGGA